jgi:hypothetical protein
MAKDRNMTSMFIQQSVSNKQAKGIRRHQTRAARRVLHSIIETFMYNYDKLNSKGKGLVGIADLGEFVKAWVNLALK